MATDPPCLARISIAGLRSQGHNTAVSIRPKIGARVQGICGNASPKELQLRSIKVGCKLLRHLSVS